MRGNAGAIDRRSFGELRYEIIPDYAAEPDAYLE
jgi:hypothetical protein